MTDTEIIDLFFERSEQAIEELAKKHGSAVARVAGNILGNAQDAEECVNDTYLGAWNAIPPHRPSPLRTFVCKIARNLATKKYHANTAEKRNSQYDLALDELEDVLSDSDSVEQTVEAKELRAALNGFMATLNASDRFLFVRRYWYSDPVRDIARMAQSTTNSVTVRLFRIRGKLRLYLEKGGIACMKRETITRMLNGLADEYISEAAVFHPTTIQESPERIVHMKKKRIITFILAAALILALGAAAYAADLFGLKALLMTGGSFSSSANTNSGRLSITQPQAVPEDMDSAIREKIDNSAAAWAEWKAWSEENGLRWPESCKGPENTSAMSEEENEDGTYTLIFYDGVDENGEAKEIGRRVVSAEDYAQMHAYIDATGIEDFPGYDPAYCIYTQEMADKLEEIAARYGLKVRHGRNLMLPNYGEYTDFYTFEEITAKVNDICAGGKSFFRTEPTGYDKFYYFDEGTFAVSFYIGEDQSYTGPSCYLYNSPYGTLSSGYEIFDVVEDVSAFAVRNHTTPDGAELTVLQNGKEAFAYIYLSDSFVTLHISLAEGMTDAEIDAVLDMVDFSAIG